MDTLPKTGQRFPEGKCVLSVCIGRSPGNPTPEVQTVQYPLRKQNTKNVHHVALLSCSLVTFSRVSTLPGEYGPC